MEAAIKRAFHATDKRLLTLFYLYLALGAIAIGLYFLIPLHLAQFVYDAFGIMVALAIIAATRLYKPPTSLAWYLLAAGQILFVVGDVTYAVYQEVLKIDSYPGLSDLFYLGAYPFFTAGVFIIIRRRNPDAHKAILLDPLLITIGVGMLSWILLIQPYMADASMDLFARLVSASYPLMDLLLLLAALRLTMGSNRNSPALYLLSASFLIQFISDTVYFLLLNAGTYYAVHPIDAGWLIAYLLLGAAAVHPSMSRLSEIVPKDAEDQMLLGRRRLILLMGGALLGPIVLTFQATSNVPLDVPVVMVGSVIMFMIVLLRMAVMMSEQNRAYKRRSESERQFSALLSNAQAMVYRALNQPDWPIEFASKYSREVTGYSPEEFFPAGDIHFGKLIVPEDRERIAQQTQEALSRGERFRLEYTIQHKNGTLRHLEEYGQGIYDQAGTQLALEGLIYDVTMQKRTEINYRALMEQAYDAILVYRADGAFIAANSAACQMLGYDQLELLCIEPSLIFGDGEFTRGFSQPPALRDREALIKELKVRCKDGTQVPVESSFKPLDDGRIQVVLKNITERKQAEESLRESERRFRLMFADNPLPMWAFDAESLQFLEVNQSAIAHYGYSRDEFLSMSIADIRPLEDIDRMVEFLSQKDSTLQDSGGWQHKKKDGQIIDVQITSHTFQSEGRHAVLVVAQDITEHKQAEVALRAQAAAEQSNKAKSEFLSRMSHELRTPLNAIIGFSQLLEMDALETEQRESVGLILNAGRQLLALINEVLEISRIEAGHMPITTEPVSVPQVIEECINLVRPMAIEKNILVKANTHSKTLRRDQYVLADCQRIKQILLNFLANAIKYNCVGGSVLLLTENSHQVYCE